jgi:hypothetical protein
MLSRVVFTHDSYLFYVKIIVNSEIINCSISHLDFTKMWKSIVGEWYTIKKGELGVNIDEKFTFGSVLTSIKDQFFVT